MRGHLLDMQEVSVNDREMGRCGPKCDLIGAEIVSHYSYFNKERASAIKASQTLTQ